MGFPFNQSIHHQTITAWSIQRNHDSPEAKNFAARRCQLRSVFSEVPKRSQKDIYDHLCRKLSICRWFSERKTIGVFRVYVSLPWGRYTYFFPGFEPNNGAGSAKGPHCWFMGALFYSHQNRGFRGFQGPLWLCQNSYWKYHIKIVDLPNFKMVIFNSYVNVYQRVDSSLKLIDW